MSASWVLLTGPVQEPISLTEAKQHAHNVQPNDDASYQRFIRSAREAAEDYMNRGLFTQTWTLTLDEFAQVIYLPRAAPLQTVTSVEYYDVNGVRQTLASSVYDVDITSRPGRIGLAADQTWPALQAVRRVGRVVITYVVGWSTVAAIPERIKQGIRMYVASLDADREGSEDFSDRARRAAEACWSDVVTWIEPDCGEYWS